MGLLSSITSAVKDVAGFASNVGGILSPISTAYTLYNQFSGSNNNSPDYSSYMQQAQSSQAAANQQMIDLSNTAYQRSMADMKAAGLNPILAGKLGGASTPNILSEFTQVPQVMQASAAQQQANIAQQQANTAQLQMFANVGKIAAEVEKIAADIGLTKGQTELLKETANLYSSQAVKAMADAGLSDTQQFGKSLQNTLDSMFVNVIKDHEFVYTAHKLDMGPGQLVDLLKTIIGKKLPNINVMRKDK